MITHAADAGGAQRVRRGVYYRKRAAILSERTAVILRSFARALVSPERLDR
jgi:hypothetical protein